MSVYGVRITGGTERFLMFLTDFGKPPYAGSGAGMHIYGVRITGGIGGKREITRKNASDHTGAMQ